MIQKPNLPDETIITCLQADYDLRIIQLAFLPLGFGLSTAVYRAAADDEKAYFCKLRRYALDFASVELTKLLSEQGINQIIPPLVTKTGDLWVELGEYSLIVYPFVEGKNGYEVELTDRQWIDFGAALKEIQTTVIPPSLIRNIPRETYTSMWRERCKLFLARLDLETYDDPTIVELSVLLRSNRKIVLRVIRSAERLASVITARDLEFVLCHSDLHPGNIFIDEQGQLFIVDWDYPILSPKERDLMYLGGGYGFSGHTAQEQETLFYRGYGQLQIDPVALAYYRFERCVIAIAVACEQILSTEQDSQTKTQILEYLRYYFRPNGAIETTLKVGETPLNLAQTISQKPLRKRYIPAQPLISLVALLLVWQLIASLSDIPSFILPSPADVWLRLIRALEDGSLLANTLVTLVEVVAGLVVGTIVATMIGYLMAKSRVLNDLVSPFIVVSQAVPFVVVAPLLVIWLGPGIYSKIFICTLIVFFPLLINTVAGVRAVPIAYYDLMQSLGATSLHIFTKVELPASLPTFLSGLRIGATLSVIGAVIGEFLGANRGLGFLINVGRGQFDTALVYICVIMLISIALALYGSVSWLEHRALVWHEQEE